ncbi:MAG: TlpA family protein disulfide reductase [Candidatus Eremiobacteraeota bacterium]|nr:TlpA family protein disulfide reductase [Candidatus Eremiobacteraeota bacterium]
MSRSALVYWVLAILLGLAVIAGYAGTGKNGSRTIGPASLTGAPAQSFSVASLSGATSSLQAYRGHIVVMNLWASWCPPCRAEMPDLQRVWLAYKNRNVVVLGVNQGESPQRARDFAQSLGIHFPVLVDQDQQYGRVYAALGLPTTIIVDAHGTIVRGFDGALTFEQVEAAIKPLLAHK